MAPLVSLQTAKTHLRIPWNDTTQDADIYAKVQEASATILDYLNTKAHVQAVVSSSSVANPTVLTTVTAHGFQSGQTLVLTGHTDSTPDLNGTWTISSVPTTTTFTIPVAVTVAGTGGLATMLWSDVTVPSHITAAVLLMLAHLFEHRGDDPDTDADLWGAIDRLLVRSKPFAVA